MADFFQTPANIGPVTAFGAPLAPALAPTTIAAPALDDFKGRYVAPRGGYAPHNLLGDVGSTLLLSPLIYYVDPDILPITAQATFINALLAAQQELSRGPRYPLSGQRWPWKAMG